MRKNARPPEVASKAGRFLNTPIHAELVKRVKVHAIETDATISEVLHGILCREFDRMDLIDQVPEPVPRAAHAAAS